MTEQLVRRRRRRRSKIEGEFYGEVYSDTLGS